MFISMIFILIRYFFEVGYSCIVFIFIEVFYEKLN